MIAYCRINSWYLQTSGEGLTAKRTALMESGKPNRDEDVIGAVQKWLPEERELNYASGRKTHAIRILDDSFNEDVFGRCEG